MGEFMNKMVFYLIMFLSFVAAVSLLPWITTLFVGLTGVEILDQILPWVVAYILAGILLPKVGALIFNMIREPR